MSSECESPANSSTGAAALPSTLWLIAVLSWCLRRFCQQTHVCAQVFAALKRLIHSFGPKLRVRVDDIRSGLARAFDSGAAVAVGGHRAKGGPAGWQPEPVRDLRDQAERPCRVFLLGGGREECAEPRRCCCKIPVFCMPAYLNSEIG